MKANDKASVSWFIVKPGFMKVNGEVMLATVEAWNDILMVTSMRVSFAAINPLVKAFILGLMVKYMKENGCQVLNRAKESGKAFLVIRI